MKLTVGMATYDDFHGVYFTAQALRLYQQIEVPYEILIIDNGPGRPHSGAVSHYVKSSGGTVRLVQMPEMGGTTQPRERIFKEAKGEYTIVLDCHVLLLPGAVNKLLKAYEDDTLPHDALVSGPMYMDDLKNFTTHFNDKIRSGMRGVWASTIVCPCYKEKAEFHPDSKTNLHRPKTLFTIEADHNQKRVYSYALGTPLVPLTRCRYCGNELPNNIPFDQYQKQIQEKGFEPYGKPGDEPFDIPGMGLGMFACRTDQWLGFNQHCREFGGEELHIHDKFRMAGRRVICFPDAGWNHRFQQPENRAYVRSKYGKVRNNVLWAQELGKTLDPYYDHFVTELKDISQAEWEYLLEDPVAHVSPPKKEDGTGELQQPPPQLKSPVEIYEWYKNTRQTRDLDQHLPKLLELADKCETVVELSKRRESTLVFAASKASVISYQRESDKLLDRIQQDRVDILRISPDGFISKSNDLDKEVPWDFLYLNWEAVYETTKRQLFGLGPRTKRFIAIANTALHGEKGEDNGPGILKAVKEFMEKYPQWSIVYATADQFGMMILGCQDQDHPPMPGIKTLAGNFLSALSTHVIDGLAKTSHEGFKTRLEICTMCPARNNNHCSLCGCGLLAKASWKSSQCPVGKWDGIV